MAYDPDQPRDRDGKWTRGKTAGGVLAAGLLAGSMTAVGGGGAVTSVGAGLDAAASQRAAEAETTSSQRAAKNGNETEAWQRMALKEIRKDVRRELRCAVQSFGQVQQFFLHHPCDKLDQLLFAVGDAKGNVIVGSVMWVKMPTPVLAEQFRGIEDTYGVGDVTPFGTEILGFGGVRFTGKHYQSRSDGALVVIAETEPLRGQPSDTLLKEVAVVADVLPPL